MSRPPKTVVTVEETLEGKFVNKICSGSHHLVADEPKKYGGDDKGPGPYEYVLMGLGACTSMTIRMYADRKGIPLERVQVTLSHRKIYADDCEDCESKMGKIDEIVREITLIGELSEAQRQRLLEIADHCPVHRTLTSEIVVRSRIVDKDTPE
ncbi:OsmC family protein [Microbulbifer thermotolerans]|uniref:OsmC family protein n=1 Tax=Microbulbifer thermotolerans TaxID=252514 RepID=A0A143HRM2_MICTH|nr:OsmC family protein [Microbulbifer thermotolerans]AMX04117.1 osmotically inducible protein C [Microbulbifer thermotolerans]MCX2779944.1 OsmC family protein [Microbulbifer thermotolerans]MCX2781860.1 OsmC family protein [Microbulbifer thermotolerans]MCX2795200.1 OsmC family protein [Microbulbifer thermotolerans]MCX2801770.1 OsmC family protein [Microbulbifer thermotolerans]